MTYPLEWRALRHLIHLFFPDLCAVCAEQPPRVQGVLCVRCSYELPETNFHKLPENPFTERFWGRLPISFGAAYYYFRTGGKVQALIHQMKYHQQPAIGQAIGYRYGRQLDTLPKVDWIIPIPLHRRKLRQRGFNQSQAFAEGLSEALGIPVLTNALERVHYRSSQTQKTREERLENMQRAFQVREDLASKLTEAHILLVDDVLTTGATLEAAGQQLLKIRGVQLSLLTMAITE